MNPRSNPRSRHCVAAKRNGHPCCAWALRGEFLCRVHHPLARSTECWGGPLDGVVVPALEAGLVFYVVPANGGPLPARIVDADIRPFPWHRVSGAYVLKMLGTEDNVPVFNYAWFEAAALAPGVLTASPGGDGQ